MRKRVYLVLWGTTLLAVLSKLAFLPGVVRFVMWLSAIVANAPGVVVIGQLFGYLWVRTIPGYLGAALLSTVLLEPLIRWLERPVSAVCQARRAFLLSSAGVAVGGYSFAVERVNYQVRSHRLYLPDLPAGLEGLRIVLMADLHCGPVNRPESLLPALRLANECKPDLVLLPGDFVHYSKVYFAEAAEWLDGLRPTIPGGVLLSWGNHDHWNGLEEGQRVLNGHHQLLQQRLVLGRDRSLRAEGKGLWLCGLDDLWEGKPDLAGLLRGIPADQPRLVLCHNPDVAEEQAGARVDLMLSGHTHGGQVRLPGLGSPILPSRYGQKYAAGLVLGPNYPVYVTRGLGVGGLPLRLGVRPEITVFELHPNTKNRQTLLV